MPSTNHLGWCVEVYVDKRIGWIQESPTFTNKLDAVVALSLADKDFERRVYEVLQ